MFCSYLDTTVGTEWRRVTTDDDGLEPADPELVRLLARGLSYAEAGETLGMSKATVYRRMCDPNFRRAVDRARSAVANDTVRSLAELVDRAVGVYAHVMDDPTASWADKLRAANSVLDRTGHHRGAEITTEDARELLLARLMEAASDEEARTGTAGDA